MLDLTPPRDPAADPVAYSWRDAAARRVCDVSKQDLTLGASDALHLATASDARCDVLYSFDKGFVKAARDKAACAVKKPA